MFSGFRLHSVGGDAMPLKRTAVWVVIAFTLLNSGRLRAQASRWTEDKAKSWYAQQSWLVGCNHISAGAINELEMCQAQSFNAAQIDKELGSAESLGMNTMRVFRKVSPSTARR